jgi:shikimate dehydrogenase
MRQYGLIGFPLGHSFSRRYFTQKFAQQRINAEYLNLELPDILQLPEVIQQHPHLVGFNVTIPHKQHIIPLLDHLDEHAAAIGAVNTVKVENGVLSGYNTDWIGFHNSLSVSEWGSIRSALILGSGGSAKAVGYALSRRSIPWQIVSRQGPITWQNLSEKQVSNASLIVNCTPLGTFPKTEECPPLPLQAIHQGQWVYDLVYNPEVTTLLKHAANAGARTINGYPMLVGQAEAAWQIWNG